MDRAVAELPLDKVLDFLKRVCPFSELSGSILKDVATSLMIEYFPEGETVLCPGTVKEPFLYLVFSGVAHCFRETESGAATLKYFSEGDHFGSETITTGCCDYTIKVNEDMICYLVKPETFRRAESRSNDFAQYFGSLKDSVADQISAHIDRQWETAPPQALWDKSSSSQFKTPVRALLGREPVCCDPLTTVGEIARIMEFTGVGSVIVMKKGRPVGIVTKNDLTWKILARKRGSDVPAQEIMSSDLLTVDFNRSCFEASLRMVEHRCHHMLAMAGERLAGVLSHHDLILLQGANPAAVVGGVDRQTDLAGIKTCVDQMSVVQQGLLAQGGRMDEIWALMTSFRDALTRRLMVLGIEEMRKQGEEPPVLEFCWITFGTPGRRETLLNENFLEGFIYKDPEKDQEDRSLAYVTALSHIVKEGLVSCGLLDRSHGQVLCVAESRWKELFKLLADSNIRLGGDALRVFDMRGLCEEGLVQRFREHIIGTVREEPRLLSRMRAANEASKIPSCFYRDLVVTSQGLQERLDLKREVLSPLVSAVRLLALEQGISAFSTVDRIEALAELRILSRERAEDLRVIYPWLVERCLARALDQGQPLDWVLEPRQCSSEEKRLLTEGFKIIGETVKTAS